MADARDREDGEDSERDEPLSDSQRIKKLEKSLSIQKLITGAVTLLVLVMLTFFSVGYFALNSRVATNTENATALQDGDIGTVLDEKFESYAKTLPSPDELTEKYSARINSFNERLDDIDLNTKKSSVAELRELMLDREQGNQTFLFALGSGMLSLSKMVRGSRTWFDEYNAQLTAAIKASKAREKTLKKLIAQEKTRLKMIEQSR